jgi:hypothetical protein
LTLPVTGETEVNHGHADTCSGSAGGLPSGCPRGGAPFSVNRLGKRDGEPAHRDNPPFCGQRGEARQRDKRPSAWPRPEFHATAVSADQIVEVASPPRLDLNAGRRARGTKPRQARDASRGCHAAGFADTAEPRQN